MLAATTFACEPWNSLHIEVTSGTVAEDTSNDQCDEKAEQLAVTVTSMLLHNRVRSLIPEQL